MQIASDLYRFANQSAANDHMTGRVTLMWNVIYIDMKEN